MSTKKSIFTIVTSIILFSSLFLLSSAITRKDFLVSSENHEKITFMERILDRIDRLKKDVRNFILTEYKRNNVEDNKNKDKSPKRSSFPDIPPVNQKKEGVVDRNPQTKATSHKRTSKFPKIEFEPVKSTKATNDKTIYLNNKPYEKLAVSPQNHSRMNETNELNDGGFKRLDIVTGLMSGNDDIGNIIGQPVLKTSEIFRAPFGKSNFGEIKLQKIEVGPEEIQDALNNANIAPGADLKQQFSAPNNLINFMKSLENKFGNGVVEHGLNADSERVYDMETPIGNMQIRKVVIANDQVSPGSEILEKILPDVEKVLKKLEDEKVNKKDKKQKSKFNDESKKKKKGDKSFPIFETSKKIINISGLKDNLLGKEELLSFFNKKNNTDNTEQSNKAKKPKTVLERVGRDVEKVDSDQMGEEVAGLAHERAKVVDGKVENEENNNGLNPLNSGGKNDIDRASGPKIMTGQPKEEDLERIKSLNSDKTQGNTDKNETEINNRPNPNIKKKAQEKAVSKNASSKFKAFMDRRQNLTEKLRLPSEVNLKDKNATIRTGLLTKEERRKSELRLVRKMDEMFKQARENYLKIKEEQLDKIIELQDKLEKEKSKKKSDKKEN